MVSSRNNTGRKNNHVNHHHNPQQQQQQQRQPGQQKQAADSDISRRLSEAEAENQELRDRLAETTAKLRAAEEQLAASAEGGNSGDLSASAAEREEAAAKAVLDARLRKAEAENESLRSKLAELATAPGTPPHRGAAAAAAASAPGVFASSPSSSSTSKAKAGAPFATSNGAATGGGHAAGARNASGAGVVEPKQAEEATTTVNGVRLSVARTALATGSSSLQDGDLTGAMNLLRRGLQSLEHLTGGIDVTVEMREAARELEIEIQLSIAEASLKQEEWAAALEAADTVLDRSPGNPTALHRRGLALARLGRKEEARVDLQEALKSGPNSEVERELLALNPAGGQAKEAESLEATLAKVRDILGTGALAAKSNRHDDALPLFQEGLEVLRSVVDAASSADGGAADPRGKLFGEATDLEVELHTKLAASWLRQHDFREALQAANKALERRPGNARATIAREAAIERLKSMGEAEAPPTEPENEHNGADGDSGASASSAAAAELFSQGSQAMELIRTCVRAAQGAKDSGNVSLQNGDIDRAKEHYEQGLKMVEVLPLRETAAELGLDLAGLPASPGSLTPAATQDIKVLKDALELEIALQLNLSLVALKREDYDGVIEAATIVLDRRPSDAKALYRRGVARIRLGQKADGCKDFKALLVQDSSMSAVVRCELERAYKVGKGKAHADWADIFQAARAAPAQDAEDDEEADSDDDEEEEEESESDEDEEEEEEEVEEDEDSDSNKEASARNFSQELTADAAGAAARAAARVASAVAAGEGDDVEKKAKASQLVSVFEQAHAMKICGNEHFKKGEYDAAVWCYRQGALQANRAVALSTSRELGSFPGVTEEARQLEVSLWLNLAQCRLKLGDNAEAAVAADEALRLDPKSVKGLFRRAKANIAQAASLDDAAQAIGRGRASESRELSGQALADLRSVLRLEPNNIEARRELAALRTSSVGSLEADEVGGGGSSGGAAASAAGEGSGSPFAGMFGDQKVLRERHRQAKERRQVEECSRLREAGNMSHRVGDYSAAEVHYSAALELDPDSAQLFLNRAAARLMLEEYTTALEDCEKAIEIQPGVAKAYLRASKCKQLLGDFEGADAVIRNGLDKATSSSDHDDLDAQRRWLSLTLRMVKDVEKTLSVDLEGASEGRRVMRLVEDLERQKQFPAAMLRPLRLRALLQARSSGTSQEALRLAEELLRQPPPQGVARTELLFWKASACLFAGERGRAKATLRDVAAAEEDDSSERPVCSIAAALLTRLLDSDGAKDRGNVFFKDRRWEDAVECYEEALRGAGQDLEFAAVLHTNISASLRKVEHREAEALKHASKAIEVNPRYAKAFFRRGVLHYDAGRWSQSFEDFRRARELEPNLQGLDKWLRRGRHAAREGKDRKNHYSSLGLSCDCEQDEIKRKFRQLARECHPDKVRDAPASERSAAEARFKAVNEAHEVLGNETSRREYDFGGGEEEYDPFGGGGGFGGSHFGRQRRPPPRHPQYGGGRSHFRGGQPWSRFGHGSEGSDDDGGWIR